LIPVRIGMVVLEETALDTWETASTSADLITRNFIFILLSMSQKTNEKVDINRNGFAYIYIFLKKTAVVVVRAVDNVEKWSEPGQAGQSGLWKRCA
jgi:hypothetical protein